MVFPWFLGPWATDSMAPWLHQGRCNAADPRRADLLHGAGGLVLGHVAEPRVEKHPAMAQVTVTYLVGGLEYVVYIYISYILNICRYYLYVNSIYHIYIYIY